VQLELATARRRRSRPQRALRALALLLIFAGALALADAVVTLTWQEPISALYASLQQSRLSGALRRVEAAPPSASDRVVLARLADERRRVAFLAGELQRRSGEGSPIGRISIPRIGASYVLVKGTSTEDLESGPGVDTETPFPGIGGTTLVAGHRTTFLAPFRHIDELGRGSRIRLQMPYAELQYTVVGQRVVAPTDVQAAVARVGYTRLVLSACTPLFSAAKRLLVFARLTRTIPRGAARLLPGAQLARPIEAPGPRRARPPKARRLPPVLEPLDRHVIPPLV
jgi:sortase A